MVARARAELHQLLDADAQLLAEVLEISRHELLIKHVMTRRHRGMRGKYGTGGHQLQGAVEFRAARHVFAATLQDLEGGVALVDVANSRRNAHGCKSPHTADAKHDFLTDSHLTVAAVKAARNRTVLRYICRDIGVQQIQFHPPNGYTPNLESDRPARILSLEAELQKKIKSYEEKMEKLEVNTKEDADSGLKVETKTKVQDIRPEKENLLKKVDKIVTDKGRIY